MQLKPYPVGRFHDALIALESSFASTLAQCTLFKCRYLPGDLIMEQGQCSEQLYLIEQGRVSLHRCASSGRVFQLGEIACQQQIIGEMEFFSGTPVQWNVVAQSELDASVICSQKLAQCLLEQPQLSLFFTCALSCDYLDSLAITIQRLLHPIAYNIAYELWRAQQHTPMLGSRKQVHEAARFGTTERVYRRALKELIEQGIVADSPHGPRIANLDKLRAYLAS